MYEVVQKSYNHYTMESLIAYNTGTTYTLKSYSSVSKGSELKVRKFLGLFVTFGEITQEKLPILNSVRNHSPKSVF